VGSTDETLDIARRFDVERILAATAAAYGPSANAATARQALASRLPTADTARA
jgi:hypothetical protein